MRKTRPRLTAVSGEERKNEKWMKKIQSQAKGIGTFPFWDDFKAGGVF